TTAGPNTAGTNAGATTTTAAARIGRGDASRRRSMPRLRTPARLAFVGIAVVLALLAGVGLGTVVDEPDPATAAGAPAELPVPLLEPTGIGDAPPLDAIAASLGPPEGEDAAAAA